VTDPHRWWGVLLLLLLLLVVAPGPAAAAAGDTRVASQHVDTIDVTRELQLTPDRPGEVGVEYRYTLPDRVTGLTVTVPQDATVTELEGFERDGSRSYAWDGETTGPSLQFAMPANETEAGRTTVARDGRYTFVDPGPWALVRLPSVGTEWQWTGSGQVTLDRRTTTDGPGVAGQALAFLGPHRIETREVDGGTLRLVVPERADLAESPDTILGSVAGASERLRFGTQDETVTMVAAPTDSVSWTVGGLQIGDSDLWVRDRERLDTANNAWLHEFVHTRQEYDTADSGRWTTEATATYYAALLTLDQERITFEEFRSRIAVGTRDPDGSAVLADPSTWDPVVPYTKGALVAGELDRRVRVSTTGRTLGVVIRRLNAHDDAVTNRDVRAAIDAAAGADVAGAAERFTETEAVPDPWDRRAHREAFESPIARMEYATGTPALAGRYRNESVGDGPLRLVTGETLGAPVTVTNEGTASGRFTARYTVNGTTVDSRDGTLDAGDSTTVELAHRFTEPGQYAVRIGDTDWRVQVSPPATPQVSSINTSPDGGTAGDVTVTAEVTNPADRPADGRVPLRVNGTTVTDRRVVLASGGTAAIRFEEVTAPPGTTLAVGELTVTIQRSSPGPAASDDEAGDASGTAASAPGFGVLAALLVAIATVFLATRRR
jgi:hypothetical protein